MPTDSTYLYYKLLTKDGLTFIYQGDFSDMITENLISLSEYNISNKDDIKKMRKRVSFLMAECFQNIVRHADLSSLGTDKPGGSNSFIARNIETGYYITSINPIKNEEIADLKDKLSHINTLSEDELKELSRNILSQTGFSDKGGAGLGLIEMSRKSKQPLNYDFISLNEVFSSFFLQVLISNDAIAKEEQMVRMQESQQLYKHMQDQHVLLLYKGDFSEDSILPVLKMIEDNIRLYLNEEKKTKKKVYSILVELLQNVSKHAITFEERKEGIFTISRIDGEYILKVGNIVSKKRKEVLIQRLATLNDLDAELASSEYRLRLQGFDSSESTVVRLGLLGIRKNAVHPIKYHFDVIDDDHFFFSITVKI